MTQQSVLLRTYIELDKTNKIRDFIVLVRAFVREQGIVGQSSGIEIEGLGGNKLNCNYLSSFSWTVLILHTLLRFQILPNIHSKECSGENVPEDESSVFVPENVPQNIMMTHPIPDASKNVLFRKIMSHIYPDNNDENSNIDQNIGKNEKINETKKSENFDFISLSYSERLSKLSVLDLFNLFFVYLHSSVDVYGSVLTMRNEGEVREHFLIHFIIQFLCIIICFTVMHISSLLYIFVFF